MVVGRRGVGKSTFLQTLCDSFYSLKIESLSEGSKIMFAAATSGDSSSPGLLALSAEEVLDPFCVFDSLSGTTVLRRCRVQIRDPSHRRPICVELIDTPGIDSHDETAATATLNEIASEIERRLQATLDDEIKPLRDKSPPNAHIHVVVYLVPPPVYSSATTDAHTHRLDSAVDILSEIDLMAIRKLGQFANVIVAIGKCDTIELADRNLLRDCSFFSNIHDLVVPTKLYDFRDSQHLHDYRVDSRDDRAMARDIRKGMLRRMPFLLCGSKHVDEWQQMRLPEYQTSSQSRVSIADWRVLSSDHNRICSSTTMITEGIFRDRRPPPNTGLTSDHHAHNPRDPFHHLARHTRHDNDSLSSMQSLSINSDTVTIKRLQQKRQISLVREFGWGTLQINNPQHCDFALFVDVIFHSFRRSLQAWTDELHYETYRMQRIAADPVYSAISMKMSEYLEAEKTRRVVPKTVAHPPVALKAFEEQRAELSRRHTENGWSRSSDMIPANNDTPSAVVSPTSSRRLIPTNTKANTKANDNGEPRRKLFLNMLTSHIGDLPLASPPDTATTAAIFPPFPHHSLHPNAHQNHHHNSTAPRAAQNSHRTSAATTLTTIVTLGNPLTATPKRPAEAVSTSIDSPPATAKPAIAQARRARRFTFGARTESGLA
ncbi:hypothetical protein EV174_002643 [Coemansia sp. RSA 2320]|nr:hypothetical protein EV174_002643 [Coemansia sp. RSA 2320]